jgi:PKD repeat protein
LQLSDGVKTADVPQASTTFFENLKPIPDFTVQLRNQTNPYEVLFDPARSQDRDGAIAKFIWMFDDNSKVDTVLNSSSITHKYTRAGQYFVRLKVVDNEGKADSTVRSVTTANQPPQASLNVFPQSGKVPLQITYNANGSFDPDGNVSSYQIFFGDGATSQTPTGTHTFATDLNYQVLLIVKDNLGLADTANVPVRVSTPPTVALKIIPDTGGSIPLKLVVSGKDSRDFHPNGSITAYRITITNIDNNSQLIFPQDSVTTTLTVPANYLIRLDVTNNRGLTSFAEKVIPAGLPGIIRRGDEESFLPVFRQP